MSFCYNYYPPDTVDDSKPYEVVPLVSSRLMALAGNPPLRVGKSGYALLLNEPSNPDPNAGDGLTPQQAAVLFHAWAAQLPNAKIICCGDIGGTQWMDAFIASCDCLAQLTGISFHDYAVVGASCATDACYLANWQAHAQAWVNWTKAHNGAYPTRELQIWASEVGFSPCCEPDETTALRHLAMLCAALPALGLTRVAWYVGSPAPGNIALTDAGGETALGRAWSNC